MNEIVYVKDKAKYKSVFGIISLRVAFSFFF